MSLTGTTIPIAFVHNMLLGVRARGLGVEDFLEDAAIAPVLLTQAGSRVTAGQYVALFKSVVDRLNDDLLGLQSRPLRRGSFALIARSAIGAPTLDVAARRVARTYGLLQDDVTTDIVRVGALAGFRFRMRDTVAPRPDFLLELLLRVFWRLLAWLAGGKLPLARVDFAFAKPSHVDSYGPIFPAPLVFDCAQSGFWFDASHLQRRVRQDEASLFNFLANAQSQVILPQRSQHTVSASVRSHLQQRLPHWPDMLATAEALHMSGATLQRKLAAEGASFQGLKDALRRDMAIVRLNTSNVSMVDLASELGFSDSAAFQRAFKGWTGSAAGAYRRAGSRVSQSSG